MFATDITLNDGTNNHVYSLVDLGNPNGISGSLRRETAAPSDQPAQLAIKHAVSGKDLKSVVSSLLRLDRVVEDAGGNQGMVILSLTARWPDKITNAATVKKTIAELVAFLGTAGFQDKLLGLEP